MARAGRAEEESHMTVVETVLVFVGIPLAAFAVLALAVLGPAAARAPRYRPGTGWDYAPVWYLPHPDSAGSEHTGSGHAGSGSATAGSGSATAGRLALQGSVTEPARPTGGASGEW